MVDDEFEEPESDPEDPREEITNIEPEKEEGEEDPEEDLHEEEIKEMEDVRNTELSIFRTLIPTPMIITPSPSDTHFIPTKLEDPRNPLML